MEPLDEDQRLELVSAMDRIRRVLDDQRQGTGLVLRAPEPGDLGWVVERHGARYAAEYGWDASFEALVARIVADFGARGARTPEAAWIAELDGERVGCVFCTASETEDTAQLRLLLVEPPARGAGVGTRLVDECLRFARRSGYTANHVVDQRCFGCRASDLPTGRVQLDRREPHTSFGQDLVGEYWSRDL